MVRLKITIDNATQEVKIPTSYDDVVWSDFVKAVTYENESKSKMKVLSALSSIEHRHLLNLTETDQNILISLCSFFWNEEPLMVEPPENVKKITIAQSRWQRLVDAENAFTSVSKQSLPQIAAAQMIIKTYTNELDKEGEVTKEGVDIGKMKVPEALGYWDFFFGSLKSGKSDGKTCIMTSQTTTRSLLVLLRFKDLDSLLRFMHSQKVTHSNTTESLDSQQSTSIPHCFSKRLKESIRRNYNELRTTQIAHLN